MYNIPKERFVQIEMHTLGILIGRFQPLHAGHVHLIKEALQRCDELLIVIGSTNGARSLKNPWTFEERKSLIEQTFPSAPLHFVGIPDFFSQSLWTDAVKQSVPEYDKTVLFGHYKDASSDYLKEFPEWQYQELPNFKGINATQIREEYFLSKKINSHLPLATEQFLVAFQNTPPYTQLCSLANPSSALTVLGFDFGLKKTGIAVGQTVTQTASPVEIIRMPLSVEKLKALLKTWKPNALIVGIPLNMNGTEGSITQPAENFAKFLESESKLPVYRVDERLTTKNARYELAFIEEHSKHKTKARRLDAFAACLIVETWLSMFDKI